MEQMVELFVYCKSGIKQLRINEYNLNQPNNKKYLKYRQCNNPKPAGTASQLSGNLKELT